ncbi:microviridin/marinostatin family tricyclic proteinase inhibitor [Chryseobacterium defluvii]|uniref:Serine endopeptidase inhibitor I10-like protein n=1 Tax=Chryseobacterium defluvii TaxID=160396 RepID=A0A495SML2_9FLAO|nr:microviridin/marinostatin family tricyclic proteinase inhibitor [Chryseobacterium defluvii]RKT01549.1 serine endopeptidase inhibitor I10-like protein [Chryseobacterium defluvii]
MKNKNSKKKPFFASFLEKQLKDPEKVKGGTDVTIPERDSVTKPIYDVAQTMKYPSDGDEEVQSV